MFTIGDKIRIIREIKGLPQKDMAARIGISQPAYSDIERSKTGVCSDKLRVIAAALDVKPDAILNFSEKCIADKYISVEEHTRIVKDMAELYQAVIKQLESRIELLEKSPPEILKFRPGYVLLKAFIVCCKPAKMNDLTASVASLMRSGSNFFSSLLHLPST
jgi:transcriptional regulator with XRE-family HTH domain